MENGKWKKVSKKKFKKKERKNQRSFSRPDFLSVNSTNL